MIYKTPLWVFFIGIVVGVGFSIPFLFFDIDVLAGGLIALAYWIGVVVSDIDWQRRLRDGITLAIKNGALDKEHKNETGGYM